MIKNNVIAPALEQWQPRTACSKQVLRAWVPAEFCIVSDGWPAVSLLWLCCDSVPVTLCLWLCACGSVPVAAAESWT
jgi:hypothetical protein